MFNRDGVIDKKDESQRSGLRNVNLTPDSRVPRKAGYRPAIIKIRGADG
jgi:hypothetical protein